MKTLLKVVLHIMLLSAWQIAYSQQYPHYTMYMVNNYLLNPAVAGIESYTDVKIAARTQWVGIDDAPKTMYLTVNSPLSSHNFKKSKIGIGGKIIADRSGSISVSAMEANFAYHLPIDFRHKLSFGLGIGATYQRLNTHRIRFHDPTDPVFAMHDFSRTLPLVNFGVWFYEADYFLGIATYNLVNNNRTLISETLTSTAIGLNRHYFVSAGYRFRIGDFMLTPSAMVKFINPAPLAYDINLKGQFSDRFWSGITWRNQDGMAAMIGFFISSTLNASYSYDFGRSDLSRHSQGSHEIVVGININNQRGPRCPEIVW